MPSVTKWKTVAAFHRDRRARVMRQHVNRAVVRRLVAPPAFQLSSGQGPRIGPNMLRPRIQAPIFSELRAAKSSSGPVAPSTLPSNLFWIVRFPRAHWCRRYHRYPGMFDVLAGSRTKSVDRNGKPRTTSFCLHDAPIGECWHAAVEGSRCHVRYGSLADIEVRVRGMSALPPESRHVQHEWHVR